MPTEDERRESPRLTDAELESIEEARALKARGEFPFDAVGEHTTAWRDLALEQRRERTRLLQLLREIRDRLAGPPAGSEAESNGE
jgi:hypothetical protein